MGRGPGRRTGGLLLALGLAIVLAGVAVPLGPANAAAPVVGPRLSLVPSPSVGNAPLSLNVTATVSGGTAPFSLTVCFGTTDHTSPPPGCGSPIGGWDGGHPVVFPHRYDAPGNYSVVAILSDARGAGVGATALIVVTSGSSLETSATESIGEGTAPLTVSFNASVLGGTPPIAIQWSFGDGTSGSSLAGIAVSHVYERAGTFTPVLTVTDAAGHSVVRTLSAVSVGGGSSAPFGWDGDGWTVVVPVVVGVLLAVPVAIGVALRVYRSRRWRREGNDLIDRLMEEERDDRTLRP